MEGKIDFTLLLIISIPIFIWLFFIELIACIVIILTNRYKRKQYNYIKEKGIYVEGKIIGAYCQSKGYVKYTVLFKDAGEITVYSDNNTYKIKDIDYNSEFKLLQKRIDELREEHLYQYSDIIHRMKNEDLSTISKPRIMDLKIGIYVLGNKAVADLDSIKESYVE